ncbi:hypothetical protein ACPC54_36445 [Kitasatospora sp. NPDC094028]
MSRALRLAPRSAGGGDSPWAAGQQVQVERLTGREPMQPAGAALLQLAWQHREVLLP